MTEQLGIYAGERGVALDGDMLDKFDAYTRLLLDWNAGMNLTAITDPAQIAVKHHLDSLMALTAAPFADGAAVLDVGSGAGFPAVPLKIARPDLRVTMLDSLRKRVRFLQAVCAELGLADCDALHERAEQAGQDARYRERFDVVCARAVANLPALCEYCLPFVRPGGVFLAMKGALREEELDGAARAIDLLGGRLRDRHRFELPENAGQRTILVLEKISQTPSKYPRLSHQIQKSPL